MRSPLQVIGHTLGPKPWFISIFRRIAPRIDPFMSRISGGEWTKSVYGLQGLVLHSTGAKSGAARANQLLYARDGDDFVVVGTNFGQAKHPAWTANLIAHPDAAVEIAGISIPVSAELIAGAKACIAETRKEPGNIAYDMHESVSDPTRMVFVEQWENAEALSSTMSAAATISLSATGSRNAPNAEV